MAERHSGVGLRFVLSGLCVAVTAIPLKSHAQLAGLFGSTSGSYCKFKKKDVINVYTQLPLDRSETFARQMTLRRLASMTRSRGFSAMVVTDKGCGTMLVNRAARFRSCKLEARMENTAAPGNGKQGVGEWFSVEGVLSDTKADVASYPNATGLMNHGNRCVVD